MKLWRLAILKSKVVAEVPRAFVECGGAVQKTTQATLGSFRP